jgi:hypothetical protein
VTKGTGELRLQVLLREPWRNDAGRSAVERALGELGMHTTGGGQASVSARATPAALATAVGAAEPDAYVPPADGELPVPPSLAEYVSSLTIAPQHIAMSRGAAQERKRGPDEGI